MSKLATDRDGARPVPVAANEIIDVLGPAIQFVSSDEGENDPRIMRSVLPPGVTVPLHSHPEPETFIVLSGRIEALKESAGNFEWVSVGLGDVFHVPGGAKHAFRNPSSEAANIIVAAPPSIGRFFREIGTPVAREAQSPRPPSANAIRHFIETSKRYGYWNATPEENARIGIFLGQVA